MKYLLLKKAWKEASEDLNININSSNKVFNDEREFLLIEDFGNEHGTIILLLDDSEEFKGVDFFVSRLGSSYFNYNRNFFIDTLNDWDILVKNQKYQTGIMVIIGSI